MSAKAQQADSMFVEFFHDMNRGKWVRTPGDPLTWRQRMDIVGGIAVFVILVGFVIFMVVCMYFIALDIGNQPAPGLG